MQRAALCRRSVRVAFFATVNAVVDVRGCCSSEHVAAAAFCVVRNVEMIMRSSLGRATRLVAHRGVAGS